MLCTSRVLGEDALVLVTNAFRLMNPLEYVQYTAFVFYSSGLIWIFFFFLIVDTDTNKYILNVCLFFFFFYGLKQEIMCSPLSELDGVHVEHTLPYNEPSGCVRSFITSAHPSDPGGKLTVPNDNGRSV